MKKNRGIPKEEILKIELYSVNGVKVLEVDELEFSVEGLEPGYYLISVLNKNNVKFIRKLFKN